MQIILGTNTQVLEPHKIKFFFNQDYIHPFFQSNRFDLQLSQLSFSFFSRIFVQ